MINKLKSMECLIIFCNFFKFGLFTIGGGMAMIPFIQKTVVEEKHWMTEAEMIDCIAIAQSLPGVIAINTATYIGNYKKGIKGAFAATFGVIMPSFIIMIAVAIFLQNFSDNPFVDGALLGVKSGSVGLIIYADIKVGKQILNDLFSWGLAILSFLIIVIFDISVIWLILFGAILGIIYCVIRSDKTEVVKK